MTTKKFIIKTIFKIAIFSILSIIMLTILSSIAPVFTNDLALGQMSNDDMSYIIWESYNKVRPIFTIIYSVITFIFIGSIGLDIYKFIKTKLKENEKK